MRLTLEKFEEAEFFLNKLKDSVREEVEFKYYLGAFASASRSVTWVLDNEYKSSSYSEEHIKWYGDTSDDEIIKGTVQYEFAQDSLCQFMKEIRTTALKREGLPLKLETVLSDPDFPSEVAAEEFREHLDVTSIRLKTRDGDILAEAVDDAYEWEIQETEGMLTVLSVNDNRRVAIIGLDTADYKVGDLRLEYEHYSDNVNSLIIDICENYLDKTERVLTQWQMYLNEEITKQELMSTPAFSVEPTVG